ncbi:MAG: sensor histidine kinase [Planctomycetota bacterium]|nr:MAG: sensor histidine kinase [Planctomycetota bacterium]
MQNMESSSPPPQSLLSPGFVPAAGGPAMPVPAATGAAIGTGDSSARGASQARSADSLPCVLIVADDPQAGALFRDLIREQFDPRTHVLEASDGRSAAQLAEQFDVELALVDASAGDDGLEVLRRLNATRSRPATIFLTGDAGDDSQLVARALMLGAREHLAKSDLRRIDVGQRIRQALERRSGQPAPRPAASPTTAAPSELDHLVRALSHDMRANFMLLDDSFRRLRRSLGDVANDETIVNLNHLEACLVQSRRFLDDLVTLGKTGQLDVRPADVDLNEIVEAVLFEQRDLLAEREIQVEVQPGLPRLWCHAERLKQIVTNLVRNAARHGCDARNPRLAIRGGKTLGEQAIGWFQVVDNGPGIPQQQRASIFQPGVRLATAHPEGSGLGLAIVEKLTEKMNGSIRIVEAPHGGTVFEVRLPTPIAVTDTSGARVDSAESAPARRPRTNSPSRVSRR